LSLFGEKKKVAGKSRRSDTRIDIGRTGKVGEPMIGNKGETLKTGKKAPRKVGVCNKQKGLDESAETRQTKKHKGGGGSSGPAYLGGCNPSLVGEKRVAIAKGKGASL